MLIHIAKADLFAARTIPNTNPEKPYAYACFYC